MMNINGIGKTYCLMLLITGIGVLNGCKDSWLDPEPLSFYAPENTYNKPGGLEAALVACERNMRHEYTGDGPPLLTELIFSDVAVDGTTDKSGPAQDLDLLITPDANNNSVNTNRIDWYWYEGFKGIKYANTVVSYIDEADGNYDSKNEKNRILGTAYFHRAKRYYRLTQQFGDVPLLLKLYKEPKLDFYSTKREIILKKMKEDLEFAEEWIPVNMDRGEVNKGAVRHLLTKVNLALGLFDDAVESASRLIDGGKYSLMTERFGSDVGNKDKNVVWDLHRPENKSMSLNTETILLVMDREKTEGNSDGMSSMRQAVPYWHDWINTPAGYKGTTDKKEIEFDQQTKYGRGIGRLRPTWYSTNGVWDDKKDLRHAPGNWITMEDLVYNNPELKEMGDPYYGKHLQLYNEEGNITSSDTIRTWFDWPHYKVYVPDPNSDRKDGGNSDWYVYRLAETYLLRAEAYVWKGNIAAAAADINKVRKRAGAFPYTSSEVDVGTVLDERARELYYEEPRKTELTRIAFIFAQTGKAAPNGKTYSLENFSEDNYFYDRVMEKNNFYNEGVVTVHGDEYTMSPYHVLWPVPSDAINSNTQGRINQNKGYSGYENNVPPLDEIKSGDEG